MAHIGFETRHGTILTKITRIMKRYYVSVTETLNKVVSVDAESEDEAVSAVNDAYNNCEIVLDSDDFIGEQVQVESDQQFYADFEKDFGETYQHID